MSHSVRPARALGLLLLSGCLSMGCRRHTEGTPTTRTAALPATTMATDKRPFFEAEPHRRQRLLDAVNHLRPNMTVDEVVTVMGEPDRDEMAGSKGPGTADTRILQYDLVIWRQNDVNELHDQYIELFLDAAHNRLHAAAIKTESTRMLTW